MTAPQQETVLATDTVNSAPYAAPLTSIAGPDVSTMRRAQPSQSLYEGKDPEKVAAELGLVCIFPGPRQLFLDIDTLEDHQAFDEGWRILTEAFPTATCTSTQSRTKPEGRHITVELPFLVTVECRLMLQAMLGSDRKRELLGLLRYLTDVRRSDRVTCFFEPRKEGAF